MSRDRPVKGEATRQRILGSALGLFAERGFADATMRDIAERAGCSLGLAYRYYPSKDAMALELYRSLQQEFAEHSAALSPGALSHRWGEVMRANMARLTPHRGTLAGLMAAGLSPGSPTQVLGPDAAPIRRRMVTIFAELVAGSTDLPRKVDTEVLATLLYGAHLLLVFFWLQDPTPGQLATAQLIAFSEDSLAWMRIALRLPGIAGSLSRLAGILQPILGGEEPISCQVPEASVPGGTG